MIFLVLLGLLLSSVVGVIYQWNRKKTLFFEDRNIPHVLSSVFGGSFKDALLLRKSVAEVMSDLYAEASQRNVPCIGARLLHKNCLIIRDLDLIKRVLVQDFHNFSNRSARADFHNDPFGGYNLFLLKNPTWIDMRKKISPVFTTSRMKLFFEDINGIGAKLHGHLLKQVATGSATVMSGKSIMGPYTTDVYASCSFGIEVNFIEDPQSVFGQVAAEMFHFKVIRALEFGSNFVMPEIGKILPTFFFSKDGSKYLKKLLVAVMDERRAKGITRSDLMDVILQIKSSQEESAVTGGGDNVPQYSDDMLLAQSVIFFVAGFETTGTALTHSLYELARNPEVQAKAKQEIAQHLKTHGKLTYDNLSELKYLAMVCQEIFRMYPAFSFLSRECTPEKSATYSLEPHMNFDVPAGFPIYVPIYALHRDEQYFPSPDKFDPERFSAENVQAIPKGAYLPFGSGPRQCLAERLAYMVMKIGLFNVLRDHTVEKCSKTPEHIQPLKLVMLVVPDKDIYVRLVRD